ncbi:MAG TPA: D-aminoacyl-tRNA deacylase [Myxococcota bacterium]|nr:D-aminoacyl-tRNA deacylase [Myxococcota bacterium]HRY95779.1 D-aminoacyl-tRNA deacylase [Myxococcota bacterium]
MRAVLQRVSRAAVHVDGRVVAQMGPGLLVLLAAGQGDGPVQADWMADKLLHLRVFPDQDGKMNRDLLDVGGELIAVSQFTLYGDCRKGRRPAFVQALEPEAAARLIEAFVAQVRAAGVRCGTGVFGAHMQVELVNDGPVTLLVDSALPRSAGAQGFSGQG